MTRPRSDSPWYHEGLAFACTRCGACCTNAPGYVWVNLEEIEALAEFRGETVDQFSSKYVRRVGDHYSLTERKNGDCIFWDAQEGCTVYPARPDPVPDLAVLARERRDSQGLGGRQTGVPGLGQGSALHCRRDRGIHRKSA